MARVELRDIVTDADREAALALRVRPDQERFVASVAASFQDALDDARAMPRMWTAHDAADGRVVGFVMISDDIPAETLAADPDLVGPYYLWRLLVDATEQRRGYGTAILDEIVAYVRDRGADILWTSCGQGPGSPQPFYERYGFVDDGRIIDDERVLRLDLAGRAAG
jgi:diamine N-acetyltransferase